MGEAIFLVLTCGLCCRDTHRFFSFFLVPGLLAIAMIPLIAIAGIVQMAMLTGEYGDKDVSFTASKSRSAPNYCAPPRMNFPVKRPSIVSPLESLVPACQYSPR